MRKLLLSVLVVGALTPAAAVALASDNPDHSNGATKAPAALRQASVLKRQATATLHRAIAGAKKKRRKHRGTRVPGALQAIAACESGGNPHAVGGGGAFRGKYQFDYGTWASIGGHGDPAAAPAAEQDRRAAMLYAREGTTPWPVCGG